jgi:glucose-6-phosphate 1-dehydrogenase
MGQSSVHIAANQGSDAPLLRARKPDPCVAVLFGVTGDLASRKLVPALYNLAVGGALPEPFALVGFSRSAKSADELKASLRESLGEFSRTQPIDEAVWQQFSRNIHAVAGAVDDADSFRELGRVVQGLERDLRTGGNRLFYLSTPASAFPPILQNLREVGLVSHTHGRTGPPWSRVIIEKPFGRDLGSARELNQLVHEILDESQVYRIDHYLGKETVQNILVFRFGNTIFEPLWNRGHIDHVQITMVESIGVEGRGAFYEETGVLRDIVQNHLLQVLALCAMEPPVSMEADEIRNMKAQVFRSLRRIHPDEVDSHVVRGQYEGYRGEKGVASDSLTSTYLALRAHIDNWRWQGVPFYLRAGKGLKGRVTEVSFHFKQIPFCLYGDDKTCQLIKNNVLKLRIQPDEGISLHIVSKVPGEDLKIGDVEMEFLYSEAFHKQPAEAYERLLLDAMRGDPTLFARHDEVELSWQFCMPILERWKSSAFDSIPIYPRGSGGPKESDRMLGQDGRMWLPLA